MLSLTHKIVITKKAEHSRWEIVKRFKLIKVNTQALLSSIHTFLTQRVEILPSIKSIRFSLLVSSLNSHKHVWFYWCFKKKLYFVTIDYYWPLVWRFEQCWRIFKNTFPEEVSFVSSKSSNWTILTTKFKNGFIFFKSAKRKHCM